jgi:hypothetical protein
MEVEMKPQFLSPLRTEYLEGPWRKLLEPLFYYSALLNVVLRVPAGFCTDFASVPRLPIAYWLFGSKANRPAVVHDYLYREGTYGRKTADRVMLEAMEIDGYGWVTRHAMYRAVRWGGWAAYKPTPGCLDYRNCQHKRNAAYCSECEYHISAE